MFTCNQRNQLRPVLQLGLNLIGKYLLMEITVEAKRDAPVVLSHNTLAFS